MTTNLLNGKIYIGQKKSKKFLPNYYGSGKALLNAVKKYGKENFKIKIIHTCYKIKCLNKWEIYYIKIYDSTDKKIGYNIAKGGNLGALGLIASDKTRKLIGKASKKTWVKLKAKGFVSPLKGRKRPPFSKRHLQNLSKGHIGIAISEEQKEKLRISMLGKKKTQENKNNSSIAAKKRWAKIPKYKRKQSDEYIEKRKLGVKLFLQNNPDARKGHNKGVKYKKKGKK
jgi:hypothetical protein